ncbi:kinase-like domain-containing protein [Suillus fuscotomentosus]|uniref:Kinase-like domain-containing protein n=1 Tax=Suillus fuscotomentosus TaxID=1912939 RepID=A0AAD4DXA1_9AGAM|nr:kinase-like domain-containing protein [Suillus fuscotomentosus]KAG1895809.1 kinase-like domain-containing protein [Suillus fuscotomentosus]
MGPPASIGNNLPPSPSVIVEDIFILGPWSAGPYHTGYYARPFPPRTWSASNSTVAVSSSDIKCKPDLVLSDEIKPKWGNIRICAELTYSQYKPAQRIVKAADTQAYLLLSNQPWRRFALILSFTHQYHELRVLLYDHAGGVVTPHIKIHQNPNAFTEIIAAVVFGSPECIGYDSTVTFWKSVALPQPPGTVIPDYRPFKNFPARTTRSVTTPAEHDSESLAALHEDPQELPANYVADSILPSQDDLEPIPPADYAPKLTSNDDLESLGDPIEELPVCPPSPALPPPLHIPLQPLAITSALLLALASRSPPQGPDATLSSTPHPSHFPHTPQLPAEPCSQICVKDKIHTMLRILFITKGLVGRGTVCYLVSLDGEEYIIKDHWVQGGEDKILNEINMLEAMSGIPGVPQLVDYWLVKKSDNIVDNTRDYRHTENPSIRGTHRTHIHLVMKPCAHPLHAFQMLKELVRVIRDITIVQRMAVECGILHRDCNLYNVMIMGEPNDSRGLLIDWEFAVFIASNDEYTIGGTGTIPFMSRALLAQMAELQGKATLQEAQKSSSKTLALPPSRVSQSFGDDLKSLFYVFTYICIKYSGPNGKECKESIHNSLLDSWSTLNLDDCKLRKVYFFAVSSEEACLERQIHPYFAKLIPLVKDTSG